MRKIILTRGKFTLVDDIDYPELTKFNWYVAHGYAVRNIRVGNRRKTTWLHHAILPPKFGLDIDHINRNKLDNRKSNLRYVTRTQNILNSNKRKGNYTSRFKGVSFKNENQKWKAELKNKHIGYFESEIEAYLAYKRAFDKEFQSCISPSCYR